MTHLDQFVTLSDVLKQQTGITSSETSIDVSSIVNMYQIKSHIEIYFPDMERFWHTFWNLNSLRA